MVWNVSGKMSKHTEHEKTQIDEPTKALKELNECVSLYLSPQIKSKKKKNLKSILRSKLLAIIEIPGDQDSISSGFFNSVFDALARLISPEVDNDIKNDAFRVFIKIIQNYWDNITISSIECKKFFETPSPKDSSNEFLNLQVCALADEAPKCTKEPQLLFLWKLIIDYIVPQIKKYPKDLLTSIKLMLFHSLLSTTKRFRNDYLSKCSLFTSKDGLFMFPYALDILMTAAESPGQHKKVVSFYKYIFPCHISCDGFVQGSKYFSVKMIRDKLTSLYENVNYNQMQPEFLSYFKAIPFTSISVNLDSIYTIQTDNKYQLLISIIEPALVILFNLIEELKKTTNKKDMIHNLSIIYGHLLRIRVLIWEILKFDKEDNLLVSFFTSTMFSQRKELSFLMLSIYFTILFDKREIECDELQMFFSNISKISQSVLSKEDADCFDKFSGIIGSHFAYALAPSLLNLPQKESEKFTNNPVMLTYDKYKYELQITLGYFFYDINGFGWPHEKAEQFIYQIIDGCDENIKYTMSASIANSIYDVVNTTKSADPQFLFGGILPILMDSLCKKECNSNFIFPICARIVKLARKKGYMNKSLAIHWFKVLQKYCFSNNKELLLEIINAGIDSILTGCPYSLGLIPFISLLLNQVNLCSISSVPLIHSYLCVEYFVTKSINFNNYPKEIINLIQNDSDRSILQKLLENNNLIQNNTFQSLKCLSCKKDDKIHKTVFLLILYDILSSESSDELMDIFKSNIESRRTIFSRSFLSLLNLLPQFYHKIQEKNKNLLEIIDVNMPNLFFHEESAQCDLGTKYYIDLMLATKNEKKFQYYFSMLTAVYDNLLTSEKYSHYFLEGFNLFLNHYYKSNNIQNIQLPPPYFAHKNSKYLISAGLTKNSFAFTTNSATFQIEVSDSDETNFSINNDKDENNNMQKFLSKIPSSLLLVDAIEPDINNFNAESESDNPINRIKMNGSRDTCRVSIVYSGFNKTSKTEILANNIEDITENFYLFLKSIGKIIDVSNEFSFLGVPKGMLSGSKAVYWENDQKKVYYQVAPFLDPDNANSQMKRWDYIRASPILIVWNENNFDVDIDEFQDDKIKLYIMLQIVNNGFVRVSMVKDEKLDFGLFYSDILIPKNFLGVFIRLVIINAESAKDEPIK